VLTPSELIRRECYDRLGLFDLSMPWCGDWYLLCLFALHYDVAYCAEPMLCYREQHELSVTTQLTTEKLDACAAEEIAVPWKISAKAVEAGYPALAEQCRSAIARTYGRVLAAERFRNASFFMNFDQFEDSLRQYSTTEAEREYLRARVYLSVGNEYYWRGEMTLARQFYGAALRKDPWMVTGQIKNVLLTLGRPGDYVRQTLQTLR
jgi:hypothetical protein